MMRLKSGLCFAICLMLSGCTGMAVNMSKPVMVELLVKPAMGVFLSERDLDLARQSLAGQLKLTEIVLKKVPRDEVKLMVCQGFSSYALLLEPELREKQFAAENTDDEKKREKLLQESAELQARMKYLSLRGRDHCLELLSKYYPSFKEKALKGGKEFQEALKKLQKKDAEALFWTGFAWGYAIINGLDDTDLIAQIPQLRAVMERVVELDSDYFYGGAHIFLGSLYSQSPTLGGDLKRAEEHFNQAKKYSNSQLLLVQYYQARFYAQQKADTKLCENLLEEIKKTPVDVNPKISLLNAWAKKMGKISLANKEEFCP